MRAVRIALKLHDHGNEARNSVNASRWALFLLTFMTFKDVPLRRIDEWN